MGTRQAHSPRDKHGGLNRADKADFSYQRLNRSNRDVSQSRQPSRGVANQHCLISTRPCAGHHTSRGGGLRSVLCHHGVIFSWLA
ncbi:tRNA U-34 5-methylaminomethyl-2-thiouridine biosynthesis protein MnmC [Anopheles sinensis]|uniref:tRNA U-34 5-methylaminomethyl-2-thiouridine biosynthesis protein MnmC n=1 Tax=Anopheles sinensis TaxID=74873 RepID=A0A084W966_ANOSI|nr:tRNA U-34 5-methylaminomethyl-2-thiouridine biosynthesis protein MnmC [Anopheles sinensis]